MARHPAPPIHPHDRALLKPLSALGKSTTMNAGVSFLRRTEYISSSQGGQRFESSTSKDLLRMRNDKRKKTAVNKDEPITIIRNIVKGFDLAYPEDIYTGLDSQINLRGAESTSEEKRAWNAPKHPTKPHLELLDSYPLLPDLDAIPPSEAYYINKFSVDPVGSSQGYDPRVDVALLYIEGSNEVQHEERLAAWQEDPTQPKPIPEYEYGLFMPSTSSAVTGIKRKLDVNDPEHENEDLYEDGTHFSYKFVRSYETQQQRGSVLDPYGDTVALSIHDPALDGNNGSSRLAKGAYYYPIAGRTNLRPKRKTNKRFQSDGDAPHLDGIHVAIRDLDKYELFDQAKVKHSLDPSVQVPRAPTPLPVEEAQEEQDQDETAADVDADADADDADDADE